MVSALVLASSGPGASPGRGQAPCSWGHVIKILLKIFYAMGYN